MTGIHPYFVLFTTVIAYHANHMGEIAALKGIQGLKGYRFPHKTPAAPRQRKTPRSKPGGFPFMTCEERTTSPSA